MSLCGDAPDTSGINEQARASAALGEKAFDWFTKEYARTEPERTATATRNQMIADSQVKAMDFATQEAQEASARNKTVFQPLENQIVADSQTFDTPGRRADASARAAADVESAMGRATGDMNREILRRGGTVDDGSARGMAADIMLGKARATASATDQAERAIEQQGYARKMDAVGLGKGIVGTQATQQQIATSTGNAATAAGGAGLAANQSGAALMQSGFNTAMTGAGQAGSLYGQAAKLSQDNSDLGGLMTGAANLGSLFAKSDKGMKKKTGKVTKGDAELAEINATPVHQGWQYDPAKGGPDDGGKSHTGPMAQDVRKTMGDQVAPDGKEIDVVSVMGKMMAATQALTRRIKALEKSEGAKS